MKEKKKKSETPTCFNQRSIYASPHVDMYVSPLTSSPWREVRTPEFDVGLASYVLCKHATTEVPQPWVMLSRINDAKQGSWCR